MIVVVTALIGPTESAPPARSGIPGTSFVAYTDRAAHELPGWDAKPAPDAASPRLAARRAKMSVLDDFPNEQWSIWLDASFDLVMDPRQIVLAAVATGCDVVALRHPDRDRIRDEAQEVVRFGLAPKKVALDQVEMYRTLGFDTEDNPQKTLTTTGLFIRRHTDRVLAFTHEWRMQVELWTLRDQLSVDFVAWQMGLRIGYLTGHYRDNPYARYNRTRHNKGRVAL